MENRTVFISYAREDEKLVLPVVRLLRAAGATVFIDIEDIFYGDKWELVLLEKIRASERLLVFWSANASKSDWVRREYLSAISVGLRVVPVPLDETPLPPELSGFQALMALVPLVYEARSRSGLPALQSSKGSWYTNSLAALAALFAMLSVEALGSVGLAMPSIVSAIMLFLLLMLISFKRDGSVMHNRAPMKLEALERAIYEIVFDPSA